MSVQKIASQLIPTSTPALSENLHAALKHFYGLDEFCCDQRQMSQGYTVKTLRYVLPMLKNQGRYSGLGTGPFIVGCLVIRDPTF